MSTKHCLRLHNEECLPPSPNHPRTKWQEEPICLLAGWSRMMDLPLPLSSSGLRCIRHGYLAHPYTKCTVSPSRAPSIAVFLLCNCPKARFLNLARIPVLVLILWRTFLREEAPFSAPSRSFYAKVMVDGTPLRP